MLARLKLNSIESKISEAPKVKKSDTERNNLIEEGKRKSLNEVIRQNASI